MLTMHHIQNTSYVSQAIDLLHVAQTEPTNLRALKQVRIETQQLRAIKNELQDETPLVVDLLIQDFEAQVALQNKQHHLI